MSMIRINEGNSYIVSSTYIDPKGDFEVFRVKDENGKNEMACFVNQQYRPTNLTPGDKVAIKRITGLTLGWKKKKRFDKNVNGYVEKWEQEFAATVDAVKVANDFEEMSPLTDEDFGGLPWDDGDLPL